MSLFAPALTLREAVALREEPDGALTLVTGWGETPLGSASPGMRAAMLALADGGGTSDAIVDAAQATEPALPLANLYFRLERLARYGFLAFTGAAGGRALLRATPTMRGARLAPVDLADDAPVRLSRFAFCRREGETMVAESPLAPFRVELLAPEASAVFAALASDLVPEGDDARVCVALLRAAGLAGPGGELAEDTGEALAQTEFHDLLYHRRSRRGWTDRPIGATFSHLGTIDPLPAVRAPHAGTPVPLPRADVDALVLEDPPFTRVLETRRSIRAYDEERPLDLEALGAFLWRTARIRETTPPQPGAPYESTSRPYPSGGATYDLEIYLTVRACDGLAPGVYHYRPDEHAVVLVSADREHVDALLDEASVANGRQVVPQVLITLASRFARLSWKYSGMAYAATLKNVGVLYQTMYLVATAMGLAPCALGNGDSALFAAATGIDPAEESSVGEFMLGRAPG